MIETLIKGGTVVDGTGAPRRQADVLVSGGKIKAVGRGLSTRGTVIDATGLTVTPGLIDPHTHLDGQLMFEPRGTPSSWHGVTTVLMGHCGYSLAPIKAAHKDYVLHMFARVEEVPPHVFQNNLPWDWETFPQYLDSLDKGLGLNAVAQVGHSSLRYHVMGPESIQRQATEAEIREMRRVLGESLAAGAFGFTTSRSPSQNAWSGEPVPSRWASSEEVISLAEALKPFKVGTLGLIPTGIFTGMTDEDKRTILAMVERSGGKPMQLNGVSQRGAWEFMAEAGKQGSTIYAVVQSQPPHRIWDLRQGTNTFNTMDTWMDVMNRPFEERRRLLASPELRPKLRAEVDLEPGLDGKTIRRPRLVWNELRVLKAARPESRALEGASIKDLARRQGKHLVDAILDLALSEDMDTTFISRGMSEADWFAEVRGAQMRHPNAYPMNTDAGAHLGNECKAGEGTYFLRHWVLERNVMSLEEGVRKVTSQAAQWIGLSDRGMVREGMAADIAVFDLSTLDALPKERAHDLPGGEMRWVQRSSGVEHVLVNGVPTILSGKETGDLPGKVLRSSAYQ